MKKAAIFLLVTSLADSLSAQDATAVWRKVLQKCATTDTIKNDVLFFGVSNTIGPGSVWRFGEHKALRLLFPLSAAIDSDTSIVVHNNVVGCVGSSASQWDIHLGLPFSTGVTPLSFDLNAALGQAKKVTVSVTGFAVDYLAEIPWKEAFGRLPKDSPYVAGLDEPDALLQESTVKVTGLKAVFDFKTDLSAAIQVKFKGKTFSIGNTTAASAPGAQGDAGGSTASAQQKGTSQGGSAAGGAKKGSPQNAPAAGGSQKGTGESGLAANADAAPGAAAGRGSNGAAQGNSAQSGARLPAGKPRALPPQRICPPRPRPITPATPRPPLKPTLPVRVKSRFAPKVRSI